MVKFTFPISIRFFEEKSLNLHLKKAPFDLAAYLILFQVSFPPFWRETPLYELVKSLTCHSTMRFFSNILQLHNYIHFQYVTVILKVRSIKFDFQ